MEGKEELLKLAYKQLDQAFVSPWIAIVLYVAIALMWFLPDRRIEWPKINL